MAVSYEISFAGEDEYIILPVPAIDTIIHAVRRGRSVRIKISIERLLPAGYVRYMVGMVNANRENKMFRYQYLHKSNIDSNDILKILGRQLGLLMINGVRCFTEVSFGSCGGRIHYTLMVNPDAYAYIKDKKREISLRKYNRSEDD